METASNSAAAALCNTVDTNYVSLAAYLIAGTIINDPLLKWVIEYAREGGGGNMDRFAKKAPKNPKTEEEWLLYDILQMQRYGNWDDGAETKKIIAIRVIDRVLRINPKIDVAAFIAQAKREAF